MSHSRDVLIRIFQQVRGYVLWCIGLHGTKLIDMKVRFMITHSLLLEDHRARIIQEDEQSKHCEDWKQYDGCTDAQNHIHLIFDM